jgi:hypothetical protein
MTFHPAPLILDGPPADPDTASDCERAYRRGAHQLLAHGWWRRRRKATVRPVERSARREDWTIGRLLRRGAACALCGRWPAPRDRRIGGRLILLCSGCDRRPDTAARLAELVFVDWAKTSEV